MSVCSCTSSRPPACSSRTIEDIACPGQMTGATTPTAPGQPGGHQLQAGFNTDNHSVMYPSLSVGLTRRNFSNYDYAWLQHLYAGASDPGSNGIASWMLKSRTWLRLPSSMCQPRPARFRAPSYVWIPETRQHQAVNPPAGQPSVPSSRRRGTRGSPRRQ